MSEFEHLVQDAGSKGDLRAASPVRRERSLSLITRLNRLVPASTRARQ